MYDVRQNLGGDETGVDLKGEGEGTNELKLILNIQMDCISLDCLEQGVCGSVASGVENSSSTT